MKLAPLFESANEKLSSLIRKHLLGKEYVDDKNKVKATIVGIEVGAKSILVEAVSYLGVTGVYHSPLINIKAFIYSDFKTFGIDHNDIIVDFDNTMLNHTYEALIKKYLNETDTTL